MTLHAEISPLLSQGAAPQPNATGIAPASGGQTDLFALLLGMTLTSSENTLADPAGAFANLTSGTSEQVPEWDAHSDTGTQPEPSETGALVDTDAFPDAQPLIADPLICTLLASLPRSAEPADEEVIPGRTAPRPPTHSAALLTMPLPRPQSNPVPLTMPDFSQGAASETSAPVVPEPDSQPVTVPLAPRTSAPSTERLTTPFTARVTSPGGQPAPEWAPLPLSDPGSATAFNATGGTVSRATAGPRFTPHTVDASLLITQPPADMSESAVRAASQSVTSAAADHQNQTPAEPLRIVAFPPPPVMPAAVEMPDMPVAQPDRVSGRPATPATSQNTMPTPAASPTSVWSAATSPALTPEVTTSVAAVRVDASVPQTIAPAEPIAQLAAQLGLTDGFVLEVGAGSRSPVPPAAISTVPQPVAPTTAVVAPIPVETVPTTVVTTTDAAAAQSVPDARVAATPTEVAPTTDAAARPTLLETPASQSGMSADEDEAAAPDKPARRAEIRVRVDATPSRTRTVEPRQQTQTGVMQRPESDSTPPPDSRNSLPKALTRPDTEPVPAVPTPMGQRTPVRATVRATSVPESPVQSNVAASASVRHGQSETVVVPENTERHTPFTQAPRSAAPPPAGPDTAAATQVRTAGQDMTPTMSRMEPVAPIQTISQTTNTIAPPEPATHAEIPEPTRFTIETPRPLPVPGRITVRLEPPELGAIRIDLATGAKGVVGRMRFESDLVRAAVERCFPELQKALADAGVRVERFEITGHTPGREIAGVWVADDTGQNSLADRAPHGRHGTGSPGDPRERHGRDDDRRRSTGTPTGFMSAGGFPVLRAGQVNLLA